jgi:thiopeptide-type bacteriocin biosynthesis protein
MSDGRRWQQFNIASERPQQAADLLARMADWAPAALAAGQLSACFFMQKPPGLRIRLADAAPGLALLLEGPGISVTPARYIAETFLFDGPAGMRLAHDVFTADTLAICDHVAAGAPANAHRLSQALMQALLEGVGLDAFECWDVWMRTLVLRGGDWRAITPGPTSPERLPAVPAAYLARLSACSPERAQLAFPSGPRRILPFLLLFHFNRMGFDAATQRALAAEMASRCHPRVAVEAEALAWAD